MIDGNDDVRRAMRFWAFCGYVQMSVFYDSPIDDAVDDATLFRFSEYLYEIEWINTEHDLDVALAFVDAVGKEAA